MKYKAIIFDLDGTLLDTSQDLSNALNHALKLNGFKQISKEQTKLFTGNGTRVLVSRAIPKGFDDPLYEKTFKDFSLFYEKHKFDYTVPYEGIQELLDILKANNYKIAVVSNKDDLFTKEIIKHYFKEGSFDFVTGSRSDYKLKPSSDLVNYCIKELNINKEEAVYVGDTNIDYDTANNASIDLIMVSYGFKPKDYLISYGAKVIIDAPLELLRRI